MFLCSASIVAAHGASSVSWNGSGAGDQLAALHDELSKGCVRRENGLSLDQVFGNFNHIAADQLP